MKVWLKLRECKIIGQSATHEKEEYKKTMHIGKTLILVYCGTSVDHRNNEKGAWTTLNFMYQQVDRIVYTYYVMIKYRNKHSLPLYSYKYDLHFTWAVSVSYSVIHAYTYIRIYMSVSVCVCVCVCVCVYLGSVSSLIHILLNNIDLFCIYIFLYMSFPVTKLNLWYPARIRRLNFHI